ncbi:MAG TPA: S24 family peptidase [Saprospiraceae bacterium]|nr:peptidase S24 [Saprospiraceae bacterium]HRO09283.1 S24 family peptidase [Saprospiraceae bacterium]HRP42315.1 S24 family peptidase [Saprospiraceae bacterium]
MCNIVTKRFVSCIEQLKELNKIKSIRQFALQVEYHPQNLSDIINGKRDVTLELLKNTIENFGVNPNFIFTGAGNMFMDEDTPCNCQNDSNNNTDKILYIPTAAHAGYTEQFQDPVYLSDLVHFTLPDHKYQHGEYRCFDVVGDSMEPVLFAGEKVVCSLVDNNNYYSSVRNNLVYVIVLENSIVVKRVKNRMREQGIIELISDNTFYETYNVHANEIKEIWHVEVKIAPFLPSPNNIRATFHDEMDDMKKTIELQSRNISSLNQTVEKLLKQNRSVLY